MKIVELDTKIFKGKKPRDWHKTVKDYVYNWFFQSTYSSMVR